jgi:hypothetical protein
MHKRLFAVLIAAALVTSFTSCSNDLSSPEAPQQDDMFNLSTDGTYDGLMLFENAAITHIEITPIEQTATMDEEHFSCNYTVDCDTGAPSFDFYRDGGGAVCVGYSTTICDWTGGNLAQAIAVYWPWTSAILDYILIHEDIDHGYIAPSPPGGCYLLTVEITYNLPGGLHGDFTVDWASACNHGTMCPPLNHFCGWPLATTPDAFVIHL